MSGMDDFKDLYLQTARERIQQLNDLLLKLESNPTQLELINELMRTGHSLKGESGAMGYTEMAILAHVIEDLFTGIGNGNLKISPELMDVLFGAVDVIGDSVRSISENNVEVPTTDVVAKIKSVTGLTTEGFGKTDKSKPVVEVKSEGVKSEEVITPATTAVAVAPVANVEKASEKITAVTIKTEKLDQMISVSEELVLLKMKLKTNAMVLGNSGLKADVHRLDRLVTDMQFHIMQARLFPISLALHTLPRLARDTAKKTGKNVQLLLEGEETTVDRTIIDHLTEPFVHMIRNAIDHGIENPEERKRVGKPDLATVKIKAYTKENKFYIEVSDDGMGIDWDQVVAAAIRKGHANADEVKGWSQKQIEGLLFVGGVSTNKEVTDVSGRGVGMGAVYQAIKKLGGSLDIVTEIGKGTTFTLRLPMTLAIMQALLVKIADRTYAVPANNVVRSIQIVDEDVQKSGDAPVIVVDDQRVPLYYLEKIFALTRTKEYTSKYRTVVLVKTDTEMIGCVADKIVSEEEILVKQPGPLLKQAQQFTGATILANGAAAPIINVEGLKWKV